MDDKKIVKYISYIFTSLFLILAIIFGVLSKELKNENYGVAFAIFSVLFILSGFMSLIFCCFKN
jgi:p-aminobenzoyl-glutamate transporter AbgT